MARTDEHGHIVPSPGQVFGDPIPRTITPLDEVDNDALIYVNVMMYSGEQYLRELDRVLDVQSANVTTGIDLTYWYDRENHIREMHDLWRRKATMEVGNVQGS